jgi:metal-responsive CopG/Arc/MetJ family transcriptional regulator
MADRTESTSHRKVTYSLPADLLDEVRQVVREAGTESLSGFVTTALRNELRARRSQRLRAEFQRAAQDPDFMRDVTETMRDFEAADAETARMIP